MSIDNYSAIDLVEASQIQAKVFAARSFGMEEDEAHARRIYIIVKRVASDPMSEDVYSLAYRDRDAAYENCRKLNAAQDRWVFKVRETVFSGPYNG